MSAPNLYGFGAYLLDTERRTLSRDGGLVRLMPKDVAVLTVLVEERGQVVTRERLRARVWPDVLVEDCNLARHVATLRQALGDSAEAPAFIETVPKVGYRFLAEVAALPSPPPEPRPGAVPEVEEEAAPGGRTDAAAAHAPPADLLAPPPPPPPQRLPWRLTWVGRKGALLGAAAVAAAVALGAAGAISLSAFSRPAGPIRSIAVVPVRNLTGDPRHDHLADALSSMLEIDLARRRELEVKALASDGLATHRDRTARDLGRELEVEGLLEAAVVFVDQQVRVTASLVDARTDRLVWAETFQGDLEALLELQDLMGAAVEEALLLPPRPDSGAPIEPARMTPVSSAGPAWP